MSDDIQNGAERALRVSQIDAEELDQGLVAMLASKLTGSLAAFRPGLEHQFAPELHLLLKLVIYRFGVLGGDDLATPGMRLQGVRYSSGGGRRQAVPRKSLILYFLLSPTFLPYYLLTRLKMHALSSSYPDYPRESLQRRWWVVLDRLEAGGKWLELAGWIAFLYDGKYPNLIARWLKLRLITATPFGSVSRMVSYEYMNRQLVWNAFTEFLLFALPAIQTLQLHRPAISLVSRIRQLISVLRSRPESQDFDKISLSSKNERTSNGGAETNHSDDTSRRKGQLWHLPKDICPICYTRLRHDVDPKLGLPLPIPSEADVEVEIEQSKQTGPDEAKIHLPTRAGCKASCVYCYYCIGDALAVKAKEVEEAERYHERKEAGGKMGGWECLRCGEEVWTCRRVVEADV